MVDGSTATAAYSAGTLENQLCDANSASDLGGTITKVELRIYGATSGAPADSMILIPFSTQYPTDNGASDSWCTYIDITADAGGPGTWTWADVINLDVTVRASSPFGGGGFAGYRVEARITYTA